MNNIPKPCKQFEHIQEIIQRKYTNIDSETKIDLNNAIRLLAEDLYKTDTHFIFELIQNAEDNKYEDPLPYISFRLTKQDPTCTAGSDGALIIENNEIGFNYDDVRAICAVGRTRKKKEQGYIGEKGIGFKSVFRMTGNPHIFSNGYHFGLPEFDDETGLGYIVPRWIDIPPKGLSPSSTHIILPLTKPNFGYAKIEEMLQDIQPEVILFLSTLKQIRIKTDTGLDFTILKDNERHPEITIDIKGNKVGNYQGGDFLVCTKTFDKPADIDHEKREGVGYRKVSIAFPMDENSTAKEKIFAYLPVRDDTGFPFLINADFILTASRDDIHENVRWNCWLMKCVADVVVGEFLPLLKERKCLSVGFLEALASGLNNLADNENDLFYPIFSSLRETFMKKELLPANDGTFVSAQNAKLADSEGLIELLKPNQLSLLFKRLGVTKWLLSDITARRTQNLWRYLRNELKIDEVDPEMVSRRIDELFLEQQHDDWFIDFYKFLSLGERPPRALWNSSSAILRNKPILRLQDNSLVNPDASNVYLSKGTGSETTSRLIKSEISQNEDAYKFLKELDILEWDDITEVIKHTLPKYHNNQSDIPREEYGRDFAKIVNAYKIDSQKKKNQLREALLTTPFILVENLDTSQQIYLEPNQLNFGIDDELWCHNSMEAYSHVSVNEKVRKFLQKLDVPRWDAVDEVIKTILPKYKQNLLKVPVKEHMKDLEKITHAYEISGQFRKGLQTELRATRFILKERTDKHSPEYCKPNELYFGTEDLRLYFQGNNSCKFISLKYSDKHVGMFRELGVSDGIRITCKSKPGSTDNIYLPYESGCYRRGLKGFDPNIQVAGLKHALMDPSVEKSKIIWEHVASPYNHCIKGKILQSSRHDFSVHAKIYKENEVTSDFGRMLMEESWLPDSDGNMHKPSEITLAELPESFEPDERLANQLYMKKDAEAKLAKEVGIPVEVIERFKNPEEYEKFKAWEAEEESLKKKNRKHRSHGSSNKGGGGHGGGGGPGKEHEDLKNDLAHNPSQLGEGLKLVEKEHRFKSGDRVDILLVDSSGKPVTVEVKPHIASESDSEVLQALKYKHLAAKDYDIPCKEVRSVLVAPEIPDDIRKKCEQLGIEPFIPTSINK